MAPNTSDSPSFSATSAPKARPTAGPTNPATIPEPTAFRGRAPTPAAGTGEFFLVQDEKARPGGEEFDTLSVMGVDPTTGGYFARSFENHGFYRHYDVTVDGDRWEISGEHERATITFSGDHRTQTHVWEWKPEDEWLPLCDRVATRTD